MNKVLVGFKKMVVQFLDAGGEWDRPSDFSSSTFGGLNNLDSGFVDGAMIVGSEADSDFLLLHDGCLLDRVGWFNLLAGAVS